MMELKKFHCGKHKANPNTNLKMIAPLLREADIKTHSKKKKKPHSND